jgi:hypothetical protein
MVGQQHVVIITATVTTAAEGHIDLILYMIYCGSTPRRPLHLPLFAKINLSTAFVFGGRHASAAGVREGQI